MTAETRSDIFAESTFPLWDENFLSTLSVTDSIKLLTTWWNKISVEDPETQKQYCDFLDRLLQQIPDEEGPGLFRYLNPEGVIRDLNLEGVKKEPDARVFIQKFLRLFIRFGFTDESFKQIRGTSPLLIRKALIALLIKEPESLQKIVNAIITKPNLHVGNRGCELTLLVVNSLTSLSEPLVQTSLEWLYRRENYSIELKTSILAYTKDLDRKTYEQLAALPCKGLADEVRKEFSEKKPGWIEGPPSWASGTGYEAVISNIQTLLKSEVFLDLLDSLEERLSCVLKEKNIDLTFFQKSQSYVFWPYEIDVLNVPWPILFSNKEIKTHSLLNQLLLEVERRHGINLHPQSPAVFFEFVSNVLANQFVSEGNLFNECNYLGNLLHGKYTHRLQWYVIFKAIEAGIIVLPEGGSATELLKKFLPYWGGTIDYYRPRFRFGGPQYFHAYLLSSVGQERFPYLSGYLRKIHADSLEKVIERNPEVSVGQITATYHWAGRDFNTRFKHPSTPEEAYGKKIHSCYHGYQNIFYKKRSPEVTCLQDTPEESSVAASSCLPGPSSSS
jgi:hypothetical protein